MGIIKLEPEKKGKDGDGPNHFVNSIKVTYTSNGFYVVVYYIDEVYENYVFQDPKDLKTFLNDLI